MLGPASRLLVDRQIDRSRGDLVRSQTECQVAEMHNGSLLMTSRMYGAPYLYPNASDPRNRRRGFARSDDGGYTWAAIWYVADRQLEIARYQPTCAQALVSAPDVQDGTIYWGHPGCVLRESHRRPVGSQRALGHEIRALSL